MDAAARSAFVRAACAGDTSLERSVAALLEHHEASTPDAARDAADARGDGRDHPRRSAVASCPARWSASAFASSSSSPRAAWARSMSRRTSSWASAWRSRRSGLNSPATNRILARFKREIQLARKVTHRNVSPRLRPVPPSRPIVLGERRYRRVPLDGTAARRDAVRADSPHAARCRSRRRSRSRVQLVAGLDAAHHAGIVHRDFKSGNVVLVSDPDDPAARSPGSDERAVIMDFGLASDAPAIGAGRARPAASPGTPAVHGAGTGRGRDRLTAATRSSTRSASCCSRWSTGTLPFRGGVADGDGATAIAVRTRRHCDRSCRRRPRHWDRTVRACLERDPARRPASARRCRGAPHGPLCAPCSGAGCLARR